MHDTFEKGKKKYNFMLRSFYAMFFNIFWRNLNAQAGRKGLVLSFEWDLVIMVISDRADEVVDEIRDLHDIYNSEWVLFSTCRLKV